MKPRILGLSLCILIGGINIQNVKATEITNNKINIKENIKDEIISANGQIVNLDLPKEITVKEMIEIRNQILKENQIVMPAKPHTTFKAYMRWTATSSNSAQYKLAEKATVDKDTAIMTLNGRYLVALGTRYAEYIGEEIDVVMENGTVIPVIVGDWKADIHTDEWNSASSAKGDILEFIVSSNEEAGIVVNGMGNYNGLFPGLVKEFRK